MAKHCSIFFLCSCVFAKKCPCLLQPMSLPSVRNILCLRAVVPMVCFTRVSPPCSAGTKADLDPSSVLHYFGLAVLSFFVLEVRELFLFFAKLSKLYTCPALSVHHSVLLGPHRQNSTVIAQIFVRDLISYISYFWRKVRNLVAYENHTRIQVYLTPPSLYENL